MVKTVEQVYQRVKRAKVAEPNSTKGTEESG